VVQESGSNQLFFIMESPAIKATICSVRHIQPGSLSILCSSAILILDSAD